MKRTQDQISLNMSKIKGKNTRIEVLLRRELWVRGLRYRKNVSSVFGHPDIAFIKLKIAIFCDSEFWHGFNWEIRKNDIKSNKDFWIRKIEKNIARDKLVSETLINQGWYVIRFYGKEITNDTAKCADLIERAIYERKASVN